MQSYTRLTGLLGLTTPRDAFVTALCKASLPPYYTLTVLNESAGDNNGTSTTINGSQGPGSSATPPPTASHLAQYLNEQEYRPQVVAVGTPLPTSSLQSGGNHGSVVVRP